MDEEEREVRVRLNVYDITAIDEKERTLTCNFYLEASWLDDEIEYDGVGDHRVVRGEELERWESMFPYERVRGESRRWTPRLVFANFVEFKDAAFEKWYRVYLYERDGTTLLDTPVVCFRMAATATFRQNFQLHRFPLDVQDLTIDIWSRIEIPTVSMHHTASAPRSAPRRSKRMVRQQSSGSWRGRLSLIQNSNPLYTSVLPLGDAAPSEWQLAEHIVALRELTDRTRSSSSLVYPQLTFVMKATRRPQYFVWNVVFPQFIFVLLCFPVLLLPPKDLVDRFSIILALLLASAAYQSSISDHLPKMSYLTWLDKYNIMCIFVMASIAIESTIVFRLANQSGEENYTVAVEGDVGIAAAAAWCALQLVPWLCITCSECLRCCTPVRTSQLERDSGRSFTGGDIRTTSSTYAERNISDKKSD